MIKCLGFLIPTCRDFVSFFNFIKLGKSLRWKNAASQQSCKYRRKRLPKAYGEYMNLFVIGDVLG